MATIIEETLRIKKYLKKLTIIGELDAPRISNKNIDSYNDNNNCLSMIGIVSGKTIDTDGNITGYLGDEARLNFTITDEDLADPVVQAFIQWVANKTDEELANG